MAHAQVYATAGVTADNAKAKWKKFIIDNENARMNFSGHQWQKIIDCSIKFVSGGDVEFPTPNSIGNITMEAIDKTMKCLPSEVLVESSGGVHHFWRRDI